MILICGILCKTLDLSTELLTKDKLATVEKLSEQTGRAERMICSVEGLTLERQNVSF